MDILFRTVDSDGKVGHECSSSSFSKSKIISRYRIKHAHMHVLMFFNALSFLPGWFLYSTAIYIINYKVVTFI